MGKYHFQKLKNPKNSKNGARAAKSKIGFGPEKKFTSGQYEKNTVPDQNLASNSARKTFCTFGHRHTARKRAVLFHFPWEALMAVTHHNDPNQFVGT